MVRDTSRQGNSGVKQPFMRSPALESMKREQVARRPVRSGKGPPARHRRVTMGTVGYTAGKTMVNHAASGKPLKSLPRRSAPPVRMAVTSAAASLPKPQRTGITAGWRLRTPWEQEQQPAVQVISEEEQKKLSALEARLPRVAGKIDSWLLISVLALACIGIVMVLPLLIIVLKFGVNVYGASRWIAVGSFLSFQPSELAKLVLALYIADWLARKGNQVSSFLYGLAPFVILVGVVLGLVLLENDMGTAIIIAGFATAMFFAAGANIVQFLLAAACGGLIFLAEAFKGYRFYRLEGFLDPFKNITSINLQLYQSLLALGSGGWFGLGLGASRQKTGYLPLPYTDSIFAILGEELGFIACAAVVVLFLSLAFRGFRLARRAPDMYGSLLATGITTWLVLQAMINIGAATGSIPYTGVPLPFISFGGSSLVVSLAAVGVLLNISRYIQEPEAPALSRRTITMGLRKAKT